jgi:chemotaxis receptor (MCP) glutamine deamidase CheD
MIHVRNISRHADLVQARPAIARLPRQNRVRIYTGDVAASTTPVMMETVLGSCVSVCLYDPYLRAGGMNHILLPDTSLDPGSTRFGVNAMEVLINELMKVGGERRRFIAKAFGGANVVPGILTSYGAENARFVRKFLATEKIPLVSERLGGSRPVRLEFRTDTGKATVHSVDGSQLPRIIHAEYSYRRAHTSDKYYSGEITLFNGG